MQEVCCVGHRQQQSSGWNRTPSAQWSGDGRHLAAGPGESSGSPILRDSPECRWTRMLSTVCAVFFAGSLVEPCSFWTVIDLLALSISRKHVRDTIVLLEENGCNVCCGWMFEPFLEPETPSAPIKTAPNRTPLLGGHGRLWPKSETEFGQTDFGRVWPNRVWPDSGSVLLCISGCCFGFCM